jgi:hypothetical protein
VIGLAAAGQPYPEKSVGDSVCAKTALLPGIPAGTSLIVGKASGVTLLSTTTVLPIIGPSTFELLTS